MQQKRGKWRKMTSVYRLLALEMRRYRRILEVKWHDRVTNDEVRSQVQQEWTAMDTIRQRKLQLLGNICRMPDDWLGMVEGKDNQDDQHRGELTTSWCDVIDIKAAVMMTEDRDNWTRFVSTGESLQSLWPQDWKKKNVSQQVWICSGPVTDVASW